MQSPVMKAGQWEIGGCPKRSKADGKKQGQEGEKCITR